MSPKVTRIRLGQHRRKEAMSAWKRAQSLDELVAHASRDEAGHHRDHVRQAGNPATGAILLVVATYSFWLPVVIMALGNDIP